MDDKPNSADVNQKKTLKFQTSQTAGSRSNTEAADTAGSSTEVNSLSEQITDNTELSSADISVKVFSNKTKQVSPAKPDMIDCKSVSESVVYICSPLSVKLDQPNPLHTLLSPSAKTCTVPEPGQSFPSVRSQDSLKSAAGHTEADGSDYCAAILLACLFCHPLECLLETCRGCNACAWSLCSSLCGCEPAALQSLPGVADGCDLCGCLGVRCFMCDCSVCDICLPFTECLDLSMEISQMLYH